MDILVPKFQANEIAKSTDFDYGNDREYDNLCTLFEELFAKAVNDLIIGGLSCQERSSPSMNVDLTIGLGYCKNTGKIAHIGSLFGPIAIVDGGAQNRIDTLEIRLKETDYDSQQRAFKDPVTGAITYQDVNTKTRFEIESQVIQGTEGAGVAPNRTVGWIKIAEIAVDAGETTSILNADIENCTGGYDTEVTTNWTAQTAITFRLGHVEDFKTKFRAKHKENGDHENDVIKDQHIDFGTGANQVSAIDMPIADAGSRITATETENAIQELAGAGRSSETIKQNQDDIDDLAGAGRTTETVKDNADDLDTHEADNIASDNTVHGIRQGAGNALDADKVDDAHAGNASGNVAKSNGTKCTNLNAEIWDGAKKTVSTGGPSGGVDGDIWFRREA